MAQGSFNVFNRFRNWRHGAEYDEWRNGWINGIAARTNVSPEIAEAHLEGRLGYCNYCKQFLPPNHFKPDGRSPGDLMEICEQCKKEKKSLRTRTYSANSRADKLGLRNDLTIRQQRFALDYFHNCCAICGRQLVDLFGDRHLAFDHWIPIASPNCPGSTVTNMIPVCHGVDGCNNSKHDADPYEWLRARYGKRRAQVIIDRVEAYFRVVKREERKQYRWTTAKRRGES